MPIEINILIIEDDTFLSELYKAELEKNGFHVFQAFDGLDGLAKISLVKPSLILLDLMMPELSGIEVLEKIKKEDNFKKIPVIILTTLRDPDTIKQVINLGAEGYLIKPALTPYQVVEEVLKFTHHPLNWNLFPSM